MSDLVVLGTDTGAGKTTFCLLWLAAFGDDYEYWKPVETGDSDSELVARLVGSAVVHAPLARYRDPVAPALAARRLGQHLPAAAQIVAARPEPRMAGHHLLVETFGSPLSPLSDNELQIRLVELFRFPTVLVALSTVGAIGRVLQSLAALTASGVRPVAIALMGPRDDYALEQISRHGPVRNVYPLEFPHQYDSASIKASSLQHRFILDEIRDRIRQDRAQRLPSPSTRGVRAERDVYGGEILERDRKFVWHPYTSLRDPDLPVVAVDAQNEFLTLADGRRVIDAISSWWTILHGHRHPVLMQALGEAAQHVDHVHFAGVTHAAAVELAERMLSTMPWPDGRVFFSDDGSTAVEVALKMAYQYWCHRGEPERTWFVGFEGGYHGDTFGAMAVGRDPVFFGRCEPLLFRAERIAVSAERLDECLGRLGKTVAAVIIEPLVQGAGGMRMHSAAELRAIYHVARNHGVLFIADEVMTGGGRTGDIWAHRTAAVTPDLVCAGKTIAGGVLPIAATLAAPEIVSAWETTDRSRTFFHGHSFTAHPLACAVGAANWRMLSGGAGPAPIEMERFWTERLATMRNRKSVKDLRIRGTIAALELDVPGGYLADVSRQLRRVCLEHGVLLRPLGNVLYVMPPFCTAPDSLDRIASALEYAVASVSNEPAPPCQ